MNQRSEGLLFSICLDGFLQCKAAEGLGDNTLCSHEHDLGRWIKHSGDVVINSGATQDVRVHLTRLQTDQGPRRKRGGAHPLAPKSIRIVAYCYVHKVSR